MSEEETKKNTSEEEQAETHDEEESKDLVDINVAVLKADMLSLEEENKNLKAENDILTKKYGQALDIIEKDTKARLIADIAPRTTVPKEILAMLSVEELKSRQKILDSAKIPAFKAGTPLVSVKDSPHTKLANMNKDFIAKLKERNR